MEKSELPSINRIIRKCIYSILFIIFFTTCYYDNEETLYPELGQNCDLTNVTWSLTVKPILQSYCLSCHSTAAASASGGGIRLENYADVKTYASNGKFYGSVSHASGYSAMPKGGGTLDNCSLQKLKKWIDDGALNN